MNAWLGVVSAEHVRRAVDLGIAQIGHGKRAGLVRMKAGDVLVYYSPVESMGDRDPLREFTALGVIEEGEIWQADEGCFKPFRRRGSVRTVQPRSSRRSPESIGADLGTELGVSTPAWLDSVG